MTTVLYVLGLLCLLATGIIGVCRLDIKVTVIQDVEQSKFFWCVHAALWFIYLYMAYNYFIK